jgi:uncharacterized linocin/CFP29 family protein
MLQERAYNYFDSEMLEAIIPNLVGTQCINTYAGKLPPGTQSVTQEERLVLQGKAKRGIKGQPVPREISDFQRANVVIPEIVHGFYLHRKDLEAAANTGDLPQSGVEGSSRLVLENIEDLIFHGDQTLGIKGIYTNATGNNSTPATLAGGKEWDAPATTSDDIFNDVVNFVEILTDNTKYTADKMLISRKARMQLFKVDQYTKTSAAAILAESGLFTGGMADILEHPLYENDSRNANSPFFTKGEGLIFTYNPKVADRVVEEEVNLRMKGENESDQYPFNIVTYQTIRVKRTDAFMQLGNLVTT